jgi:hypothetical protein
LEFVQFPAFLRDWRRLGLGDDALRVLEQEIMDSPDKGPVIEHSGGLRKMRFSPPESRKGKRGAFRVCYAYYPQFGSVALFVVFGKNDRDDVSPSEATAIAKALKTFETELRRQFERLR